MENNSRSKEPLKVRPNPKSEIRNPKQIQITKQENPKRDGVPVSDFLRWDFGFVSNFGFRISDLEFQGSRPARIDHKHFAVPNPSGAGCADDAVDDLLDARIVDPDADL